MNRLAGIAIRLTIVGVMLCGEWCRASVPSAVAAAQAVPAVKESVSFLKEVAEVPIRAGEILCLPWGLVECVFSPFPDISFMSGLRHIGKGVMAPFKLVESVVTLPYDAVSAAGRTVESVSPVGK